MPIKYTRDLSDNKLFPEIQVNDLSTLTTNDCIAYWDADTLIYQIASILETKTLKISAPDHGIEPFTSDNITSFKGRGKVVSKNSELGILNIKREAEGLEPLSLSDFIIEEQQTLDGTYDEALELGKITIYQRMKRVRFQYRVKYIKLILGEGDNFRNKLKLARPYKGNRKDTLRPLLLKPLREWAINELEAEMAPKGIEADDLLEMYARQGYMHYRRKRKFNKIAISADKDAMNSAKLLINPDTYKDAVGRPVFKFPKPVLIEAADKSVGDIELVPQQGSMAVKGYGFKFFLYQAFLGKDSADNYNCLGHLGFKFGDSQAYTALHTPKTCKEALKEVVQIFTDLIPNGCSYEDQSGVIVNLSTAEIMDAYFKCAYMRRKQDDDFDFYKMAEAFNVDISHLINNYEEVKEDE